MAARQRRSIQPVARDPAPAAAPVSGDRGNAFAQESLPAAEEQDGEYGHGTGGMLEAAYNAIFGPREPAPPAAPAAAGPSGTASAPGAEAGSSPAVPAAPARPSGPLRVDAFASATQITNPRRVGAGERVSFAIANPGITGGVWTASGGRIESSDAEGCSWHAPAEPGPYTVTVTLDGQTASRTIHVKAPEGIVATPDGEGTFNAGQQGVMMYLQLGLAPMAGVSWDGISFREESGPPGVGSGYWSDASGGALDHHPTASWGVGTETNRDEAGISGQPNNDEHRWQGHSHLVWSIPYSYRLVEDQGPGLPIAHAPYPQEFQMHDAHGTTSVRKHRHEVRRTP